MPATPFEYAWRPLQRLKVSLISVSFTAKVQGSKMWQITGKWLLGNNHSNSRAGQSRVSAANAVRRTQVYGKQLSDYGHKSIKRLKYCCILLWWSGPADGCQLLRQKLPWSRMRRSPNGLSTSVLSWLKRCKQFSFGLLSGLYNNPAKASTFAAPCTCRKH